MIYEINVNQDSDGMWFATSSSTGPDRRYYGTTWKEAACQARAATLRNLADRFDAGELDPHESVDWITYLPDGVDEPDVKGRFTCLLRMSEEECDGCVLAECPQLGVATAGKTIQEACTNLGEAITLALDVINSNAPSTIPEASPRHLVDDGDSASGGDGQGGGK